jgi:hypothetical protein
MLIQRTRQGRIDQSGSGIEDWYWPVEVGGWVMEYLNKLEQEVAAWPEISVRPHRFGGKEF